MYLDALSVKMAVHGEDLEELDDVQGGLGPENAHAQNDDAFESGAEDDENFRASSGAVSDGSWESNENPPLELNYDALKHIARYYLPGNHGKCVEITTKGRGSYHEIRRLHFEDGWTCIGRFTRDKHENVTVAESEIATREYILKHTSIRVPQTYFVNLDPTNAVGAPFVLMERIEGRHLYCFWWNDALKAEYKLSMVLQVADVLAQLARLKFARIGSLVGGGTVGALQNPTIPRHEPGRGPFESLQEYAHSFLREDAGRSDEVMALYPEIEEHLTSFLSKQTGNLTLEAPYRLIHGDFDGQNMLFTWENLDQAPKLSGIIDWDNSYTGPLYYLCEYPIFIVDTDLEADRYDENKILRKRFVRKLADGLPAGSEDRQRVRQSFRQKNRLLNGFNHAFTSIDRSPSFEKVVVGGYLGDVKNGRAPYGGRHDYDSEWEYKPDSELESEEGEEDDDGQ